MVSFRLDLLHLGHTFIVFWFAWLINVSFSLLSLHSPHWKLLLPLPADWHPEAPLVLFFDAHWILSTLFAEWVPVNLFAISVRPRSNTSFTYGFTHKICLHCSLRDNTESALRIFWLWTDSYKHYPPVLYNHWHLCKIRSPVSIQWSSFELDDSLYWVFFPHVAVRKPNSNFLLPFQQELY